MMLEDLVDSLGHRVAGTADSVDVALARVAEGGFNLAILDVQLRGGQPSWPVADALSDRGVAFLLSTGGHLEPPPARHADARVLAKPFTIDSVEAALNEHAAK